MGLSLRNRAEADGNDTPFCITDLSVGGGSGVESLEKLRWRCFSVRVRLTTVVREAEAISVGCDILCRDCFTFALELVCEGRGTMPFGRGAIPFDGAASLEAGDFERRLLPGTALGIRLEEAITSVGQSEQTPPIFLDSSWELEAFKYGEQLTFSCH